MRFLFVHAVLLVAFVGPVVAAPNITRNGSPKDCCIRRDASGHGLAQMTIEFRLAFLKHRRPDLGYKFGEELDAILANEESRVLPWTDKTAEPGIEPLATIKGRQVIRATYPKEEKAPAATILLALETAKGSGWFAPFFVARPDDFEYKEESSSDVEASCILTFHYNANNGWTGQYVFELAGKQPVFLGELPLKAKVLADGNNIRKGSPKDCFLGDLDGLAKVPFECRLSFLKHQQPEMDSQFAEAGGHRRTTPSGADRVDARCLAWTDTAKEPEIQLLTAVKGRKVIKVTYHEDKSDFGSTVLTAMETAKGSDWFAPFFMAGVERFEGEQVSTNDMEAGYIATLSYSGTGAFRSHFAFELHGKQPVFLATISNGRCHRGDYGSDESYEKAYAQWEKDCAEEQALCEGILSRRPKARHR